MLMENLLIIGAGQYGMVAKEIAESMGIFEKTDFLDDNNPIAVGEIDDYRKFRDRYECAVVAIGNTKLRLKLINELKDAGYKVPALVHERAYISPSVVISEGCFIEPMAVVNTDVRLEKGCIISAGAVINHNAVIEQGCHINCGSVVRARKIVPSCTVTSIGTILE